MFVGGHLFEVWLEDTFFNLPESSQTLAILFFRRTSLTGLNEQASDKRPHI